MEIKSRLLFFATIAVVPEPPKGSKIHFLSVLCTILSINSSGNGAGCGFFRS